MHQHLRAKKYYNLVPFTIYRLWGGAGGGITSFSGEAEGGSVVAFIEFKRGEYRKLAAN